MKRKQKLLSVLLVFIIILTFASCIKADVTQETEQSTTENLTTLNTTEPENTTEEITTEESTTAKNE